MLRPRATALLQPFQAIQLHFLRMQASCGVIRFPSMRHGVSLALPKIGGSRVGYQLQRAEGCRTDKRWPAFQMASAASPAALCYQIEEGSLCKLQR